MDRPKKMLWKTKTGAIQLQPELAEAMEILFDVRP